MEHKRIIAIIQARMGSTRLPSKVLKEVAGIPLLKYQVNRVNKSILINDVVIATSDVREDDKLKRFCANNNIKCFRGSENDVLSRYYECANKFKANVIVRLTGDCPLVDPKIIDDVINLYFEKKADFASNTVPPKTSTFPDGSDVETFSMEALERAHMEVQDPKDREHVTFYFWKYNKRFKTAQLTQEQDWSKYRFTVDYIEDLEVVEFIIKKLIERNSFGYLKEIIGIIDSNPIIKQKNAKYYFGIGWK